MDQVRKFLSKVYRGVGSARAMRLHRLLDSGEWALLQKERMSSPSVYQNAQAYLKDALVVELTRKLLLPGDSDARRRKAVETFWASETQCADTNRRLHPYLTQQWFNRPCELRVANFINSWRKEMKRALGPAPKNWRLTPRFSGGSTLSDVGKLITIPDKMSSLQTVTARAIGIADDALYGTPLAGAAQVVIANRFFTVPKDSEKDRGCCVEPSINVALQLDVGRLMKARYRESYQVDLAQAQPLHRKLAQRASSGELDLVTVDLSNASDTVAKVLVEILLPSDWFALLNSLRSHSTEIDGQIVLNHKFSSMGNGFTFELETFIFRSLMATLGCKQAFAYGDDLICERERADDLLAALGYFGFTPNVNKTFCEGPFRESCGGDFFDGQPVRAHYLKELPDEPQKWLALANGLRRADPSMLWLHAAWRYCVDQLPTDWRNYGPESLGDTVVHVDEPERHTTMRQLHPHMRELVWCPSFFDAKAPHYRTKIPVSRKYALGAYWSERIAMIAGALGVPEFVSTRDDVIGYKTEYVIAYGVKDPQAGFDNQ